MPTASGRYCSLSIASSSSARSRTRSRLSGGFAEQDILMKVQPISVTATEVTFPTEKSPKAPPKCNVDFWWAPKQRKTKRAQQKLEEELSKPYINVMYEKRVVRGANFGQSLMDDVDPFNKADDLRRQKLLRKISEQYNCKTRNKRNVIGTVPPVPGRAHIPIQTEKYLEELEARAPEFNAETQTDLFLERPPMPPYKPFKVGVDASTEIGDGELFHFDAEAQPIIDVLVDGAIEHSILEVAQEQEISALRAEQEKFLTRREAELAKLRRLEAEELRLEAEKERRQVQDQIAKQLDDEMQRAVVAAKLIQGHVSSLLPEIYENLEPASDECQKDHLLKTLCPWLAEEVKAESKQVMRSRNLLNNMIAEIVKDRAAVYGGYCEEFILEPFAPADEGEEGGQPDGELEACSCLSSNNDTAKSADLCGPNDKKV